MSNIEEGRNGAHLLVVKDGGEHAFVLSDAELRLIERLRAMRSSASKMIFDLSEECECVFPRTTLPRLALVRRAPD